MLLRSITKHVRDQNWFAVGAFQGCAASIAILCAACAPPNASDAPYITSPEPLRIVSANDGRALFSAWGGTRQFPDSLTVIDLLPNAPPVTRTVEGAAPNTFAGAPYMAVVSEGRFAFIPNHPFGASGEEKGVPSQITVVDLETDNLAAVHTFNVPHNAWQAMAHPDDTRVIAISDHQFHLFAIEDGQARLVTESDPFGLYFTSFAISPNGTSIITTAAQRLEFTTSVELHLFELSDNVIRHVSKIGITPNIGEIDQPFAPRFSPDGKRALVLNGLEIAAKPPLDAVLSIDMAATTLIVSDIIPNVAQGLESLAFHPSGKFAVVTCIDGPYTGHLAVIDLASPAMRVLYYIPIDAITQGIEFSPDGSMLFVQSTTASHITVYAVDGNKLTKHPYTLHTGEGPGAMALSTKGGN